MSCSSYWLTSAATVQTELSLAVLVFAVSQILCCTLLADLSNYRKNPHNPQSQAFLHHAAVAKPSSRLQMTARGKIPQPDAI